MDYDDPAHEADLARERRRQLEADISPEEAEAECGWSGVRDEWDEDPGDDRSDDDYHDDEDYMTDSLPRQAGAFTPDKTDFALAVLQQRPVDVRVTIREMPIELDHFESLPGFTGRELLA